MSRTATATLTVLTAASLLLAACGSDDSTGGPDEPVVPTTIPLPDDIVLDGEPRPLFGSGASADEEDALTDPAEVDAEAVEDDQPVTTVNPCPPDVDPNDPVCQGVPDVAMPVDDDDFIPAPADAGFCTMLESIEQRPWPTDEFDQLRVTQIWLAELQAVVPDAIAGDLGRLTNFIDQVVEAGEDAIPDLDIDPELDAAANRIGEYVDTNCSGF